MRVKQLYDMCGNMEPNSCVTILRRNKSKTFTRLATKRCKNLSDEQMNYKVYAFQLDTDENGVQNMFISVK